ncbi:MAG: ATP phosphoribosyltransferase regulatory subunit [Clostridia bacterium]|nr:ATP phosphoribosyltransferase regulatory subunit [Clostridia bacterium]
MKNFSPIRGTNDYMPKEAKIREIVRQKILSSYQNNGYNLISTPILENLELLNMSDGGDNLKLMFKTVKRGDKLDLTKENLTVADIVEEGLRYDLTVPLARFYANNREKLPNPFKAIQIDYSFRAERPQRGRDRQFIQCDIDVFGDKTINAELELLKTALSSYKSLGFNDLTLKINNRQILNQLVLFAGFKAEDLNTVCVTLDKIDKIAVSGVVMELLDKGFDAENINKLTEEINDVIANGLNSVVKYGVEQEKADEMNYLINNLNVLTNNQFNIRFDISIVRGQGYYTGPVFEFYTDGFSGAIGGGGRYDKMIGKITGIEVPAVGVSMGFEPITMLIRERGITFDSKENLALIYDEEDDIIEVFKIKEQLMRDYNVSLFKRAKNMKNFFEKVQVVANLVTSVKDFKEGKEIKVLQ